MKKAWLILLVIVAQTSSAQEVKGYADILQKAPEINLSDSLFIQRVNNESGMIDSATAQKWFAPVFTSSQTGKLKKRQFFIAGKITSNEYFDLLMLMEEKKKADSTTMQVLYLVTTKKDGDYIASLKAAIWGQTKKVTYNVSSWLYKGMKIVQDSRIGTSKEALDDLTEYIISSKGRFIASAKN